MKSQYVAATDAFDDWRDDVLSGTPPTLFPIGTDAMRRIEIGPGIVSLVGGPPGTGKTALTMQWTADALRLSPELRAVVCNVEMSPGVLMDRQLARLSGVDLTAIRHRQLGAAHAERIDAGLLTLESFADRLAFCRAPFDLENAAATVDDFAAGLLILDYIQRIAPPGTHDAQRSSVNATMNYIRQFADAGVAVIVVAAVGRTKDAKGRSSYSGDGLNLASFRESSELEFGADDAFILVRDDEDDGDRVRLRHFKSRHGETRDIPLNFNRPLQRFTVRDDDDESESKVKPNAATPKRTMSAMAEPWNRTPSAAEGETP